MTETAPPLQATPRRERTRERLMDAAFDTFAEEGFAASSVEAISERAGFSRGAFYYNFASKEELFLAMIERSIQRRLGTVDESATMSGLFGGLGDDEEALLDLVRGQGDEDDLKWVMVITEFRLHAIRGNDTATAAKFDTLFRTVIQGLAVRFAERAGTAGATFTVPADMVATLAVGAYMEAVIDSAVAQLEPAEGERLTAERLVAVLRGLVRQP
ncbi:TetR/AcrR family transcriptional regulator [uncultured Amnibacterium sp.]|uniref:TetR/AcrR family transcriptional regulator n=1 Tax=uncultured Amnibacterium sp. TaxID=1631851 RepID=UPI0035CC7408